ncbi:MAG: hypothetical protein FWD82_07650 [Defluviitaleaceae bacterium]|nr:hypothetical protein [Defluviitaleaceae bacterium]
MNYIWELAIKAITQNIDPDTIFYKYGRPFSGYMELSFFEMNETNVLNEVEINPFYRYYRVFKELFEPNVLLIENEEMIDVIHDLTIHHLKDIDVLMGMNKREYQIHFIIKDMYAGYFGEYIKENIDVFTREEQKIVANNLLKLHETAECIYLLKETIRKIFKNAYIFSNAEEKDEIVFFLRTDETQEKMTKIEIIKYLFLPFKASILVYWQNIFGVFGVDELMKIGEIMNY